MKLSVVTAETIFAPDISANIEDGVLYTVDGMKIQIYDYETYFQRI